MHRTLSFISLLAFTTIANAGDLSLTPSKWKAEDYSATKPRYLTITSPWSVNVPTEPREIGYVTTPAPSFTGPMTAAPTVPILRAVLGDFYG